MRGFLLYRTIRFTPPKVNKNVDMVSINDYYNHMFNKQEE